MVAMALIVVALAAEPPAKPSVSAMARPYSAAVNMHQDSRPMGEPPVAIAIEISAASETLWTGNLRVGGSGGSSFSESRSEFEEPCPGRPEAADRYYSSNHQLSFNINRQISPENPDRFTAMERKLREYGAVYYLLETWGTDGELYRFHCRMAIANNPNYTRHFEATDRDALKAMSQVLARVEAWRAGRLQ